MLKQLILFWTQEMLSQTLSCTRWDCCRWNCIPARSYATSSKGFPAAIYLMLRFGTISFSFITSPWSSVLRTDNCVPYSVSFSRHGALRVPFLRNALFARWQFLCQTCQLLNPSLLIRVLLPNYASLSYTHWTNSFFSRAGNMQHRMF